MRKKELFTKDECNSPTNCLERDRACNGDCPGVKIQENGMKEVLCTTFSDLFLLKTEISHFLSPLPLERGITYYHLKGTYP